ncbi:MFS transporter [Mycoplasmatota bacterium WC44]
MIDIRKDKQINKFCWYGLLKNLKFFEPYLILYLKFMGLSLFQIGLLYTVREVVIYLFEVPSGVFADNYGKKTELMLSFVFYIISFVFFFVGEHFEMFIVAMLFFGLGEAFRSGTHKAMIMAYLDKKKIKESKAKVYGRTRSYSLIGSTLSSLISIVFVLKFSSMSWLFIVCILPYIIDFFLIMSYPDFLNEKSKSTFTLKDLFHASVDNIKYTFTNKDIVKTTMDSSLYSGLFKTIKDYIQPVLSQVILVSGIITVYTLTSDEQIKVTLGIVYSLIYALSAVASRNSHRLLNKIELNSGIFILSLLFAFLSISVGISVNVASVSLAFISFVLINVITNIRRPLLIQKYSEIVKSDSRATVLSIDS